MSAKSDEYDALFSAAHNAGNGCGHTNDWSEAAGSTSPELPLTQRAAADLEVYKLAAEHFRQDIAAHWTQASFSSVIQAAFISIFATAVGPQEAEKIESLMTAKSEAT